MREKHHTSRKDRVELSAQIPKKPKKVHKNPKQSPTNAKPLSVSITHTSTHAHTHTRTHAHTHTRTHAHTHTRTHAHTHTRTHVHTYTQTQIHTTNHTLLSLVGDLWKAILSAAERRGLQACSFCANPTERLSSEKEAFFNFSCCFN